MAGPERDSVLTTSLSVLEKTFAVKTFGPHVTDAGVACRTCCRRQSQKSGIVSSRVSSIADNGSGGNYAYRASKAAVNSVGRSMAMDLRERKVPVLLLHPGFVQSGHQPEAKMPPETVMPEEAARKLWEDVVKVKDVDSTGTFWHREGFELQW